MNAHAHDRDELEALKAWWMENRWFIIGGLIISFGAVFGWRYWQHMQRSHAEAASDIYQDMLASVTAKDMDTMETLAGRLRGEYADTPYASLAALKEAELDVEGGKLEAAEEPLRWTMENTGDEQLSLLARMRLARVMLSNGQNDDLLALLASVDAGKYAPLYDELRGDALFAKGDRDAAREAWQKALDNLPSGMGDRQLLQMKIENFQMPLTAIKPVPGEADAGQPQADSTASGKQDSN